MKNPEFINNINNSDSLIFLLKIWFLNLLDRNDSFDVSASEQLTNVINDKKFSTQINNTLLDIPYKKLRTRITQACTEYFTENTTVSPQHFSLCLTHLVYSRFVFSSETLEVEEIKKIFTQTLSDL
ncbi:MAG: hypothetical protein GW942_00970 [Candidatus Pacebacteria bacterium]|nr:hypothetical protein [Candidatus Paceibacterota bacterium]